MNTTIALFLIVLLVLCIGGPLAGLVAVKRAHAFRIEDGHLVAGRVVSRRYPLRDIERVAFTAQGSERAGYVGAFVVQTRHAGASGNTSSASTTSAFAVRPRRSWRPASRRCGGS